MLSVLDSFSMTRLHYIISKRKNICEKSIILNLEQHNIDCSTARAQYQVFSTISLITCSHNITCSRSIREQELSIKSNNVFYYIQSSEIQENIDDI